MTSGEHGAPVISVVVPTHNRRPLLRQVLLGLAQQTYPGWKFEVIVVDDASTDGTPAMLEALSTPYDLRILRREHGGPAATRNAGLAAARGQAVIFLDDDVIPNPELVGAHAIVHELDDRAVVIGRVLPCCNRKKPGWEYWEDYIAQRDYERLGRPNARVHGGLFYTWNVSAARASLNDVGGFDTTLAFQEDIDLGYRLEASGAHFYFRREAAGQHCGHRPTYATWARRHYRFGYFRMVMQQRDSATYLGSLRKSVTDYHPLTQQVLRLTVGRAEPGQVAEMALRGLASSLDALHLWQGSRLPYSVLAIHHYWRGVADAHGDPRSLRQQLFGPRAVAKAMSANAR
jgi:glycosyltransferase involved in cell wall biosynthesis